MLTSDKIKLVRVAIANTLGFLDDGNNFTADIPPSPSEKDLSDFEIAERAISQIVQFTAGR